MPVLPARTFPVYSFHPLQALHHPYIYPVLDLDFATIANTTFVITVIPHNAKGTLKDLIYKVGATMGYLSPPKELWNVIS